MKLLEKVPTDIIAYLGIKPSYSCMKCGNTENFQVTIKNNFFIPEGHSDFWDSDLQHVESKDCTLICSVCNYQIIVHKDV